MLYCINTESVNAHIDKILVAVYKIIINLRILCIEVEAVISKSGDLNVVVIPVTAACPAEMMVYLVGVH